MLRNHWLWACHTPPATRADVPPRSRSLLSAPLCACKAHTHSSACVRTHTSHARMHTCDGCSSNTCNHAYTQACTRACNTHSTQSHTLSHSLPPCTLTGGGVHVASEVGKSGMPVPQLHASVKKVVSLFDGPRTVLSSKAWVNVDPQAQKVSGGQWERAVLKQSLTHMYNHLLARTHTGAHTLSHEYQSTTHEHSHAHQTTHPTSPAHLCAVHSTQGLHQGVPQMDGLHTAARPQTISWLGCVLAHPRE